MVIGKGGGELKERKGKWGRIIFTFINVPSPTPRVDKKVAPLP